MRTNAVLALCVGLGLCLAVLANVHIPVAELSFRPPFMNNQVPNWMVGGDATLTDQGVRLTPARQSRAGWMWAQKALDYASWTAVLEFRIHGARGPGGDGMAFWYTKDAPMKNGPLFGSPESWVGLGIFVDTYDNDGKRNNPFISAIVSNGDAKYDYNTDNIAAIAGVASCVSSVRETTQNAKLRIVYDDRILQVLVDSQGKGQYQSCFTMPDVDLPPGYYFGVTAATGAVADNHDVMSLEVSSIQEEAEIRQQELKDEQDETYISLRDRLMRARKQRWAGSNKKTPKATPAAAVPEETAPVAEVAGAGRNAEEEAAHHHETAADSEPAAVEVEPVVTKTAAPATRSTADTQRQVLSNDAASELKSMIRDVISEVSRMKHMVSDAVTEKSTNTGNGIDSGELHALKGDTSAVRQDLAVLRHDVIAQLSSLQERAEIQRTQTQAVSDKLNSKDHSGLDELRNSVAEVNRNVRAFASAQVDNHQALSRNLESIIDKALRANGQTTQSSGGWGVIAIVLGIVAALEAVVMLVMLRARTQDRKRFV